MNSKPEDHRCPQLRCTWNLHSVAASFNFPHSIIPRYIPTNVGHILWLVYLEMLGTYSVRGIPGYTTCKRVCTYKCWTYPVADVPRNVGYLFCEGYTNNRGEGGRGNMLPW